MFQYLLTLADIGMTTQLQEEVEKLYQNAPLMAQKLAKMFNEKISEPKDDFEQMFESQLTNMFYATLWMFIHVINTPYEVLLVYFEKYGADPMKRSLRNQLIAQMGHINILVNLVNTPILVYRILIGTINPHIAAAYVIFSQSLITW